MQKIAKEFRNSTELQTWLSSLVIITVEAFTITELQNGRLLATIIHT